MFSMASAVSAGPSATRWRISAALVGSLAIRPNGVRLPSASPPMTAANAVRNGSASGGSRHCRQATVRSAKRAPVMSTMAAKPQPIARRSLTISARSAAPMLHTYHAKSASPATAETIPVRLSGCRPVAVVDDRCGWRSGGTTVII